MLRLPDLILPCWVCVSLVNPL